jgi:hypothetical protein
MTGIAARIWNETDIPSVSSADLAAALALWLARERQGIVLVGTEPIETLGTIEAAVISMHDCPARGLSVLLRLRCLVAAIGSRRFRHLLRAEHATALARLIAAAATLRLNPTWGMSPVRLAWSMDCDRDQDGEREAARGCNRSAA